MDDRENERSLKASSVLLDGDPESDPEDFNHHEYHDEESIPGNKSTKSQDKNQFSSGVRWAIIIATILFWIMVIYSLVVSVMMANMMVNDQEHTASSHDESRSRSRSGALNFDSNGPIFSLYDGTVRGTVDNSTGALQFFGLPYAAPPTGSNRFRPPIRHELWKSTNDADYDASYHGSPCLSGTETLIASLGTEGQDFEERSEDCLYLNIWVPPSVLEGEKKSVLFFVHGGSFIGGNANRLETNGRKLAVEQDVIVVSVQYRLGVYGFGYVSRRRDENVGHFEQGNFGLQDVRLALRIVHENIHFFGGDNSRITVMGNSAGAIITGLLLSDEAPVYFRDAGWPFFQGAVMQCTPINIQMRTPAQIIDFNNKIADAAGCETLECFQKLSNEKMGELLKENTETLLFDLTVMSLVGTPFGPIEDNITAFNVNKNLFQSDVPILIGINADEPVSFLNFLLKKPMDVHIYHAALDLLFSDKADDIRALYPPQTDNRDNMVQIEQDAIFDCPTRRLLQSVTTSFKYEFHGKSTKSYNHWSKDYEWGSCEDNSCHCTDTVYTFGQYEYDNEFQEKASKNLQNFIGSFVRNVNQPKISSNETFPESSNGSIVAHLGFDDSDEIKIVENGKKSKCDLWDELKTRADLCGMGEKDKCFIDWAKLTEFVQKIKAKMQKN